MSPSKRTKQRSLNFTNSLTAGSLLVSGIVEIILSAISLGCRYVPRQGRLMSARNALYGVFEFRSHRYARRRLASHKNDRLPLNLPDDVRYRRWHNWRSRNPPRPRRDGHGTDARPREWHDRDYQSLADEIPMTHIVKSGFREGVLLMLVWSGTRISDVLYEVAIREW